MNKYTPGPWSCQPRWETPETVIHAVVEGEAYALAQAFGMRYAEERMANARLIAAAPDLLAVAEMIEALSSSPLQRDYVAPQVLAAARAAIAKATV